MSTSKSNSNKAKIGGVWYTTNDYGKFKVLLGNRDVSPERVAKIKKSIQERGYIWSPILVNEKYEVIDGQGRLQALKELGMQADYYVSPGLTIADCVAMNINAKNWTTADFVKSYADQGNENYIRLQNLIERFPTIQFNVILTVAKGNLAEAGTASNVKEGNLKISSENYESAKVKLEYLAIAHKYIKKKNSLLAVAFCMSQETCNKDRLMNVIKKNHDEIEVPSSVKDVIQIIENCYNARLTNGNRILFREEYRKACNASNASYKSRWE